MGANRKGELVGRGKDRSGRLKHRCSATFLAPLSPLLCVCVRNAEDDPVRRTSSSIWAVSAMNIRLVTRDRILGSHLASAITGLLSHRLLSAVDKWWRKLMLIWCSFVGSLLSLCIVVSLFRFVLASVYMGLRWKKYSYKGTENIEVSRGQRGIQ